PRHEALLAPLHLVSQVGPAPGIEGAAPDGRAVDPGDGHLTDQASPRPRVVDDVVWNIDIRLCDTQSDDHEDAVLDLDPFEADAPDDAGAAWIRWIVH